MRKNRLKFIAATLASVLAAVLIMIPTAIAVFATGAESVDSTAVDTTAVDTTAAADTAPSIGNGLIITLYGMVGIFFVMAVIALLTYLLKKTASGKTPPSDAVKN